MRVFLSALIILVLVACNYAPDEVAVEETTAEVLADTAQVIVEEVDSIEIKAEEEEEEAINRSNLLELYEVIETARLQNDFSTIKKYVKSDTFAFYYWPIKSEELDKIDFGDLDSLLFDGGACRGCGDYHPIYKHAKDFIVHKKNEEAHLDSNWRKNIIITEYPHNPRNDSIMQLLTECNICDPQFDDDGAVHSFLYSNFGWSKKNTNNIIFIQALKNEWGNSSELLVFSEENGQYSLLGFHDFVEFQNEECNVYDPDKDSVVFSNDTIIILRGNAYLMLKSELYLKEGKLDGSSKKWYRNGQLEYKTNSINDENDRLHIEWYENGQLKSERNYKEGKENGFQKQWYKSGQLQSEASFKDGSLDGLKKYWYKSGQLLYEENYKEGKQEGLSKNWHENGQLRSEENYKEGKQEGLSKYWYENGQLRKESNYLYGLLYGLTKSWHENGQLKYETNYSAGSKYGLDKSWHENGQLKYETNYYGDSKHGLDKSWHENGQLKYERNYIKGKQQGLSKGWYKNGQLHYERNYNTYGDEVGLSKCWHENGQLDFEGNYNKYGEEEGIWFYYNEEGKLIKKRSYKEGELINTERF